MSLDLRIGAVPPCVFSLAADDDPLTIFEQQPRKKRMVLRENQRANPLIYMAILSRKTCALAIKLLQRSLTKTQIEIFFYEHDVPNDWVKGDTGEKLLFYTFRILEQLKRQDLLWKIVQGALDNLHGEYRQELEQALMRDGFVLSGKELVPEETRSQEHKTGLGQLVKRHAGKLTSHVLTHHLNEAEELFRIEKWDSSIGHARNFVEQLLKDIADFTASGRKEKPDLGKPVKVRDYLEACGFLDQAERKKLVDGVYGYFSEEGSHPGITEQSTARVCLSILWTFGFYVLEKLDAWNP